MSTPTPTNRTIRSNPELGQASTPNLAPVPRATTFPTPTQLRTSSLQEPTLDGARLQHSTSSNPNLRQSYHELMSPVDMSAKGTPESITTSNSVQTPYMDQQQFGIINNLPDLSAMMFPSADPFAYPNQPMMEYDNVKQENMPMMNESPAPQLMFSSNGHSGRIYDDLEGQLFGPIPPYLQQGQPSYNLHTQVGNPSMMEGVDSSMGYHTGVTLNNDGMLGNFDGIFSGDGGDWSSMLADPRFRQ
jgi:hypothetical protein